jgi:hypothetical protein
MVAPSNERVAGTSETDWYWDLNKQIAVRGDNRGPADHTLGPYPTKAEAENWKTTAERRNDIWDSDDEEWNDANSNDD